MEGKSSIKIQVQKIKLLKKKKKLSKIVKPGFLKFGITPHNLNIHLKIVFWGFDFVTIMSLLSTHDI